MLLHTENIDEAIAEVEAAGGHVLLQLGQNLLVAKVPSHVAKQNSFSQASAHISSSASAETLSHASAYWMAREDELKPQPMVQHWTEKAAPMALEREYSDEDFQGDSPFHQTMDGKIAVVIIIASGPGSLAINDSETNKIKSKCQAGLKFWSDQAWIAWIPLVFVLEFKKETISATNPTSCPSFASCHNVFADPILQSYGYPPGIAGRDQYAQSVKDATEANGAYLAFFSKYNQRHFAYAYYGSGPIYMQYSGFDSDQIDRVFAHETGHVFNAPDENVNQCDCRRLYGKGRGCTATNANCRTCTRSQVSCIMNKSDLSNICDSSKKHVGWC